MSTPHPSLPPPRKAAIIGIGLLGGSVGLAIRERWPTAEVVGVSRTAETRQTALRLGCVTAITDDIQAACSAADWVFLCTPVGQIAAQAIAVAPRTAAEAIITDVGSTKARLVAEIEADATAAERFVGSHPIAGGEKSGPQFARADLFVGKSIVVTPTPATDPDRVTRTGQMWSAIGGLVRTMSPDEHDVMLAGISHATHFASCAIAADLDSDAISLVGSGWRDTTRVAAGDPRMWTDIALQNASPITRRLRAIQDQLAAYISAIETRDAPRLTKLLVDAKRCRDAVPPLTDETDQ